jgi:hypothetical protein
MSTSASREPTHRPAFFCWLEAVAPAVLPAPPQIANMARADAPPPYPFQVDLPDARYLNAFLPESHFLAAGMQFLPLAPPPPTAMAEGDAEAAATPAAAVAAIALVEGRNIIGRSVQPIADPWFVHLESPRAAVSRAHAHIFVCANGDAWLEDCGSTNGTLVASGRGAALAAEMTILQRLVNNAADAMLMSHGEASGRTASTATAALAQTFVVEYLRRIAAASEACAAGSGAIAMQAPSSDPHDQRDDRKIIGEAAAAPCGTHQQQQQLLQYGGDTTAAMGVRLEPGRLYQLTDGARIIFGDVEVRFRCAPVSVFTAPGPSGASPDKAPSAAEVVASIPPTLNCMAESSPFGRASSATAAGEDAAANRAPLQEAGEIATARTSSANEVPAACTTMAAPSLNGRHHAASGGGSSAAEQPYLTDADIAAAAAAALGGGSMAGSTFVGPTTASAVPRATSLVSNAPNAAQQQQRHDGQQQQQRHGQQDEAATMVVPASGATDDAAAALMRRVSTGSAGAGGGDVVVPSSYPQSLPTRQSHPSGASTSAGLAAFASATSMHELRPMAVVQVGAPPASGGSGADAGDTAVPAAPPSKAKKEEAEDEKPTGRATVSVPPPATAESRRRSRSETTDARAADTRAATVGAGAGATLHKPLQTPPATRAASATPATTAPRTPAPGGIPRDLGTTGPPDLRDSVTCGILQQLTMGLRAADGARTAAARFGAGGAIVACVTGMGASEKQRVKRLVSTLLGGSVVDDWTPECNLLIVKDTPCERTPKLLMAVGCGCPVVTPKFFAPVSMTPEEIRQRQAQLAGGGDNGLPFGASPTATVGGGTGGGGASKNRRGGGGAAASTPAAADAELTLRMPTLAEVTPAVVAQGRPNRTMLPSEVLDALRCNRLFGPVLTNCAVRISGVTAREAREQLQVIISSCGGTVASGRANAAAPTAALHNAHDGAATTVAGGQKKALITVTDATLDSFYASLLLRPAIEGGRLQDEADDEEP